MIEVLLHGLTKGVDLRRRVVEMARDAQVAVAVAFCDRYLDLMLIPQSLLQWMNCVRTGFLRRVWW